MEALVTVGACGSVPREKPIYLAPNAPQDTPIRVHEENVNKMDALLEPCKIKALASYPNIQRRFEDGLPSGNTLFVTIRLRDARGYREQIFLAVDRMDGETVVGRISTDIRLVQGYRRGQMLVVPQSAVIDWTISRPDGTEEGNFRGRFIDAFLANDQAPAGVCDP